MITRIKLPLLGIIILVLALAAVGRAEKGNEDKIAQAQKRRQIIKAAKARLDNTAWKIKLTEMTSGRKKRRLLKTPCVS